MSYVRALHCRECQREYPVTPVFFCEYCFGPLEATYDYDAIKRVLTRAAIESRPLTMWRYRELLPVSGDV
ncbi:MAG: threonine synthase, partial [Dehalococcoidia bacterium]|nr:threonine synthase [Dehalococcoidia bacterium]